MIHTKYKLSIFLAVFLWVSLFTTAIHAPTVHANALSYGINCSDKSNKLDISSSKSKDEATVKCNSGSKFTLALSGSSKSSVKVSCPGEQDVATKGGDANGSLSQITFYCVNLSFAGGEPNSVATHDPVTVKSTGAKDGSSSSGDGSSDSTEDVGVTHNSDDCSADSVDKLDKSNCGIIKWIIVFTNVLAGIAGTVIVAMIVWGGIQYSMAGPDPSKVQAAKKKIMSALTALLLLIFGFSIIQWLVPGGLF